MEIMYIFFITVGLNLIYALFLFLFPFFFYQAADKTSDKSLFSFIIITIFSFASYFAAISAPSDWFSNRLLHFLVGGFLSILICFLAVKDINLKIGKFQFFLFSFLLAVALGVGNEIIEFMLQNYFELTFARSVTDTWLDLISNVLGALLAAAVFTPFINPIK